MHVCVNLYVYTSLVIARSKEMNRNWMQLKDRLCNEYVEGVRTFIQAARQHLRVDDKTRCPCRQCLNVRFQDLVTVEQHLIRYGFSSSYNR